MLVRQAHHQMGRRGTQTSVADPRDPLGVRSDHWNEEAYPVIPAVAITNAVSDSRSWDQKMVSPAS